MNKKAWIIVILLVILLLAGIGYLGYSLKKEKKANQDIFHDDEPKQKSNIADTTEEDEDEDEDEEEENVGFLQRIFGKKKRVPVDGGQQDIFHDDNSDPFFKAAYATVPSDPVEEDYSALNNAPLHAGADTALVRDFFGSIAAGKEPSATLHSAFPGHLLCYKAERQ